MSNFHSRLKNENRHTSKTHSFSYEFINEIKFFYLQYQHINFETEKRKNSEISELKQFSALVIFFWPIFLFAEYSSHRTFKFLVLQHQKKIFLFILKLYRWQRELIYCIVQYDLHLLDRHQS